jgi:hypothetical protein
MNATRRLSRTTWIILSILLALPGAALAQSKPVAKVNKNLVNISASDEQGMVLVQGEPGAIESSSPAELQITNEQTGAFVMADIQRDASFQAKIAASADDKIRLAVRNEEGKKGRTTIKVPLGYVTTPRSTTAAAGEVSEVTVWIRVVDKKTGRLLVAQNVDGTLPASPIQDPNKPAPSTQNTIQNLVDKCVALVKGELQSATASTPPTVITATTKTKTTAAPKTGNVIISKPSPKAPAAKPADANTPGLKEVEPNDAED